MQTVTDQCYEYNQVNGGILKLTAKDGVPMKTLVSYYLLPNDIEKFKKDMIKYPEYGYLYVYGYDKNNNMVMGIVGSNLKDFALGHTICAEMMEEDLGDTFEVVLSGTILTKNKTIFMNDASGHYYDYIYPKLIKYFPNFDILKYYNKYISKNIKTLLDTQTNIIFKSYLDDGSFDYSYNKIEEIRLHDRICTANADFNIYDSEENCRNGTDPIGKFCDKSKYKSIEDKISNKITAKYNSYDVKLLKLIQKIYLDTDNLEDNELMELNRKIRGKVTPFTNDSRRAIISLIKRKLNLKNHLHLIQKIINQKIINKKSSLS